jgi:hypothetical protein
MWSQPFNIFYKMSDKGKEFAYYKIFEPAAKPDTIADWGEQLGKPCSVIIKQVKKDDVTYDNIGSLAPIPKKYQDGVGEAQIEPCIGDADDDENQCTKALFGLARWVFDRRLNEDAYVGDEQKDGYNPPEPQGNEDGTCPF